MIYKIFTDTKKFLAKLAKMKKKKTVNHRDAETRSKRGKQEKKNYASLSEKMC